ncbi:hypothetical protein BESB_026050 [Besnoitia besnoiti]|uniref:Pan3 C-terminal knob domain-containing protein n=1 Tax=Besnoitia besnoiti TaxID=94643 RepID=A0A2A9M5P4_BESBE|nr:uncharacterized protein BESB_026050 [Besnoitia besnoiti]PFH31631.1 hypothetical protein BESB_026050 [Besnoitia besnoiti]
MTPALQRSRASSSVPLPDMTEREKPPAAGPPASAAASFAVGGAGTSGSTAAPIPFETGGCVYYITNPQAGLEDFLSSVPSSESLRGGLDGASLCGGMASAESFPPASPPRWADLQAIGSSASSFCADAYAYPGDQGGAPLPCAPPHAALPFFAPGVPSADTQEGHPPPGASPEFAGAPPPFDAVPAPLLFDRGGASSPCTPDSGDALAVQQLAYASAPLPPVSFSPHAGNFYDAPGAHTPSSRPFFPGPGDRDPCGPQSPGVRHQSQHPLFIPPTQRAAFPILASSPVAAPGGGDGGAEGSRGGGSNGAFGGYRRGSAADPASLPASATAASAPADFSKPSTKVDVSGRYTSLPRSPCSSSLRAESSPLGGASNYAGGRLSPFSPPFAPAGGGGLLELPLGPPLAARAAPVTLNGAQCGGGGASSPGGGPGAGSHRCQGSEASRAEGGGSFGGGGLPLSASAAPPFYPSSATAALAAARLGRHAGVSPPPPSVPLKSAGFVNVSLSNPSEEGARKNGGGSGSSYGYRSNSSPAPSAFPGASPTSAAAGATPKTRGTTNGVGASALPNGLGGGSPSLLFSPSPSSFPSASSSPPLLMHPLVSPVRLNLGAASAGSPLAPGVKKRPPSFPVSSSSLVSSLSPAASPFAPAGGHSAVAPLPRPLTSVPPGGNAERAGGGDVTQQFLLAGRAQDAESGGSRDDRLSDSFSPSSVAQLFFPPASNGEAGEAGSAEGAPADAAPETAAAEGLRLPGWDGEGTGRSGDSLAQYSRETSEQLAPTSPSLAPASPADAQAAAVPGSEEESAGTAPAGGMRGGVSEPENEGASQEGAAGASQDFSPGMSCPSVAPILDESPSGLSTAVPPLFRASSFSLHRPSLLASRASMHELSLFPSCLPHPGPRATPFSFFLPTDITAAEDPFSWLSPPSVPDALSSPPGCSFYPAGRASCPPSVPPLASLPPAGGGDKDLPASVPAFSSPVPPAVPAGLRAEAQLQRLSRLLSERHLQSDASLPALVDPTGCFSSSSSSCNSSSADAAAAVSAPEQTDVPAAPQPGVGGCAHTNNLSCLSSSSLPCLFLPSSAPGSLPASFSLPSSFPPFSCSLHAVSSSAADASAAGAGPAASREPQFLSLAESLAKASESFFAERDGVAGSQAAQEAGNAFEPNKEERDEELEKELCGLRFLSGPGDFEDACAFGRRPPLPAQLGAAAGDHGRAQTALENDAGLSPRLPAPPEVPDCVGGKFCNLLLLDDWAEQISRLEDARKNPRATQKKAKGPSLKRAGGAYDRIIWTFKALSLQDGGAYVLVRVASQNLKAFDRMQRTAKRWMSVTAAHPCLVPLRSIFITPDFRSLDVSVASPSWSSIAPPEALKPGVSPSETLPQSSAPGPCPVLLAPDPGTPTRADSDEKVPEEAPQEAERKAGLSDAVPGQPQSREGRGEGANEGADPSRPAMGTPSGATLKPHENGPVRGAGDAAKLTEAGDAKPEQGDLHKSVVLVYDFFANCRTLEELHLGCRSRYTSPSAVEHASPSSGSPWARFASAFRDPWLCRMQSQRADGGRDLEFTQESGCSRAGRSPENDGEGREGAEPKKCAVKGEETQPRSTEAEEGPLTARVDEAIQSANKGGDNEKRTCECASFVHQGKHAHMEPAPAATPGQQPGEDTAEKSAESNACVAREAEARGASHAASPAQRRAPRAAEKERECGSAETEGRRRAEENDQGEDESCATDAPSPRIPETLLWSYLIQLLLGIVHVHKCGVAVGRALCLSKILVNYRYRLRIAACGLREIICDEEDVDEPGFEGESAHPKAEGAGERRKGKREKKGGVRGRSTTHSGGKETPGARGGEEEGDADNGEAPTGGAARDRVALLEDAQRGDLRMLGEIMLTLACAAVDSSFEAPRCPSSDFLSACFSHIVVPFSGFSGELKSCISQLLSSASPTSPPSSACPSAGHLLSAYQHRVSCVMTQQLESTDTFEALLFQEMEASRLMLVLFKLHFVALRAAPSSAFASDRCVMHPGDSFLLSQFFDFLFKQDSARGEPALDLCRIYEALHKLDAGAGELLPLHCEGSTAAARVSYHDLRRCVERSFAILLSQGGGSLCYAPFPSCSVSPASAFRVPYPLPASSPGQFPSASSRATPPPFSAPPWFPASASFFSAAGARCPSSSFASSAGWLPSGAPPRPDEREKPAEKPGEVLAASGGSWASSAAAAPAAPHPGSGARGPELGEGPSEGDGVKWGRAGDRDALVDAALSVAPPFPVSVAPPFPGALVSEKAPVFSRPSGVLAEGSEKARGESDDPQSFFPSFSTAEPNAPSERGSAPQVSSSLLVSPFGSAAVSRAGFLGEPPTDGDFPERLKGLSTQSGRPLREKRASSAPLSASAASSFSSLSAAAFAPSPDPPPLRTPAGGQGGQAGAPPFAASGALGAFQFGPEATTVSLPGDAQNGVAAQSLLCASPFAPAGCSGFAPPPPLLGARSQDLSAAFFSAPSSFPPPSQPSMLWRVERGRACEPKEGRGGAASEGGDQDSQEAVRSAFEAAIARAAARRTQSTTEHAAGSSSVSFVSSTPSGRDDEEDKKEEEGERGAGEAADAQDAVRTAIALAVARAAARREAAEREKKCLVASEHERDSDVSHVHARHE